MSKFAYFTTLPMADLVAADIQSKRISQSIRDERGRQIPRGSHVFLDGGDDNVMIGIFRTPTQYVNEAVLKPHPSDSFESLADDVKEAVHFLCTNDDTDVVKHRARMVAWVRSVVSAKMREEHDLHGKMHPEVAKVVEGLNILALEEVCKHVGFVDEYLFDGLKSGFSLSGVIPPTGRWDMRHRPAAIPEHQWASLRHFFCRNVVQRTVSSGNVEDDNCLWEVTCSERDRGWLTGPYETEDAVAMFGEGLAPARRFLVRQKGKPRPIDDYSISGTNATVETWEKPFLQSLDELVVHIRYLQRGLVTSKGTSSSRLLGRTVDLEDAFRHLPTNPVDGRVSCVSVFCPSTGKAAIFRQAAMPFGSVTSVHAFARLSEAIRTILVRLFKVISTAYVDDFSLVDAAGTAGSVSYTVECLLTSLGIRFSRKSTKRMPFRSSFRILGVELLLNSWVANDLKIVVRNTQDRKSELEEELDAIDALGRLSPWEAARLRGRFGFFLTGLWGRAGALFLRALEVKAANLMSGGLIGEEERFALDAARVLLRSDPRQIDVLRDELPFWVFTDASVEPTQIGEFVAVIGGILYNPGSGQPVRFFSHKLPHAVIKLWETDAPLQPITFAETLPVIVAKILWRKTLNAHRSVFGVDNVGAVQALIKMTSGVQSLAMLLRVAFLVDRHWDIRPWYHWVPSESNPADDPSRGVSSGLLSSGSVEDVVSDELLLRLLSMAGSLKGGDLDRANHLLRLDQEG